MTEVQASETVAIIGAGAMGGAIARRLADVGCSVRAYDPNEAQVAALRSYNVVSTRSIAEVVEGVRFVITCLPNGTVLRSVVGEIVSSLSRHTVEKPLVLDCSTVAPSESFAAYSELRSIGVDFVDMPVGRTTDDCDSF